MKLEQLMLWMFVVWIILFQGRVIFVLIEANNSLQQDSWKIAQWHGEDLKKCVRIESPI